MREKKVSNVEMRSVKGGFNPDFTVSEDLSVNMKISQYNIKCIEPAPLHQPCHSLDKVEVC